MIVLNQTPYEMLVKSEIIKRDKTRDKIPGFYNFIPSVYNVFIKMPFKQGKLAEDEDIEMIRIQDLFQFFIYDFPLKIRNIYNLMEIGSYFDATILFRSLIESFIIYKYYIMKRDGTGLSNYFLQNSKVRIKDIFEKVIPGYYDSLYSELCKATHSNPLMQAIFRGNVSKDTPIKSDINNINIDWFSYVSNQLEPVIIGTIELYKYVYPNNTLLLDKNAKTDLDYIYNFINGDIEDRKKKYPQQKEMIDYYNEIIKI